MTKDKNESTSSISKETLQEWVTTIGGGSDPIGIEASNTRRSAERAVAQGVLTQYWAHGFLGDALHQLYMDTLREMAKVPAERRTDPLTAVYVQWHIVTAERFFASYDLMMRGYYSEGASLARSLWETALTLAALHHGILDAATMFQIPGIEKPTRKDYTRYDIETDRRVQEVLIWKNKALTEEGREAVRGLLALMNAATHKGMLALARNNRQQQETGGVDFFPTFDARMTEVSFNILYLTTWALFSTIRYLVPPLPDFSSPWGKRYELALQVFERSKAPTRLVDHFGVVIQSVFGPTATPQK
jgi:hypothetical protein